MCSSSLSSTERDSERYRDFERIVEDTISEQRKRRQTLRRIEERLGSRHKRSFEWLPHLPEPDRISSPVERLRQQWIGERVLSRESPVSSRPTSYSSEEGLSHQVYQNMNSAVNALEPQSERSLHFANLERQNLELRRELTQLQKQRHEELVDRDRAVNVQVQAKMKLEGQLFRSMQENKKLKQDNQELQQGLENTVQQMNQIEARLTEKVAEVERLEARLPVNSERLRIINAQLGHELRGKVTLLSNQEATNDQLKTSIEWLKARIGRRDIEIKSLKQENQELRRDIPEAKSSGRDSQRIIYDASLHGRELHRKAKRRTMR
jgi:hypothetical protein